MKEMKKGSGDFFRQLRDVGISAVIVSDPALIEICATTPRLTDPFIDTSICH